MSAHELDAAGTHVSHMPADTRFCAPEQDTIDMCVLYWADGTWCYECEYDERDYANMSDDFGHLTVSMMLDYEQVDALVRMACIGGSNCVL